MARHSTIYLVIADKISSSNDSHLGGSLRCSVEWHGTRRHTTLRRTGRGQSRQCRRGNQAQNRRRGGKIPGKVSQGGVRSTKLSKVCHNITDGPPRRVVLRKWPGSKETVYPISISDLRVMCFAFKLPVPGQLSQVFGVRCSLAPDRMYICVLALCSSQ